MIYFDNAATGGFKPRAVYDALSTVAKYLSANPGRSGHRLSVTGAKILCSCRELAAESFNCSPDRVIFTKNCTEALNVAILGTVKEKKTAITTVFEHNSVLRPLHELQKKGRIFLDIVSPDRNESIARAIEEKITPDTYLVAVTAVSNVTGESLPIKEIGKICKKYGLLFLVDGAQGGGHVPLNMKENDINLLALAGHKGLFGVMGSGALLISDETEVAPLITGGTGTESFNLLQPDNYPERLEAGTLNLPAVAALCEGLRYLKENFYNFSELLCEKTSKLIKALSAIPDVKCFSKPNPAGIVSFSVLNKDSADVADVLDKEYDVAVRGGLHCAPLAHRYLGTEGGGLVRASLAVQNSAGEADYFIRAIKKIAGG